MENCDICTNNMTSLVLYIQLVISETGLDGLIKVIWKLKRGNFADSCM